MNDGCETSHRNSIYSNQLGPTRRKNTERLGCRGFDVLHVALALQLKCEVFLSRIQGALAHSKDLRLTIVSDGTE
jgi:hypothetical protein